VVAGARDNSAAKTNVIGNNREAPNSRFPASVRNCSHAASRQVCVDQSPLLTPRSFSGEEEPRLPANIILPCHGQARCAGHISVQTKFPCARFMSEIATRSQRTHYSASQKRSAFAATKMETVGWAPISRPVGHTHHKNFSASCVWATDSARTVDWPNNVVYLKSKCEAVRELGWCSASEELAPELQLCVSPMCGIS